MSSRYGAFQMQAKATDGKPKYASTLQALNKILQQDGPSALFQGAARAK